MRRRLTSVDEEDTSPTRYNNVSDLDSSAVRESITSFDSGDGGGTPVHDRDDGANADSSESSTLEQRRASVCGASIARSVRRPPIGGRLQPPHKTFSKGIDERNAKLHMLKMTRGSALAASARSLGKRFVVRRVLLQKAPRSETDLEYVHNFLESETKIKTQPFWRLLSKSQRLMVCNSLHYHIVEPGHQLNLTLLEGTAAETFILVKGSALLRWESDLFISDKNAAGQKKRNVGLRKVPGDTFGCIGVPVDLNISSMDSSDKQTPAEKAEKKKKDAPGKKATSSEGLATLAKISTNVNEDPLPAKEAYTKASPAAQAAMTTMWIIKQMNDLSPSHGMPKQTHSLGVLGDRVKAQITSRSEFISIRTHDIAHLIEGVALSAKRAALLSSLGLMSLERHCQTRFFSAQSLIIEEGMPAEEIIVVVEGSCRAFMQNRDGSGVIQLKSGFTSQVDLRNIACLGSQSLIGDIALLADIPQPVSVFAVTAVETLVIPAEEFLRELDAVPRLHETLSANARTRLEWIRNRAKHKKGEVDWSGSRPVLHGDGDNDEDDSEDEDDDDDDSSGEDDARGCWSYRPSNAASQRARSGPLDPLQDLAPVPSAPSPLELVAEENAAGKNDRATSFLRPSSSQWCSAAATQVSLGSHCGHAQSSRMRGGAAALSSPSSRRLRPFDASTRAFTPGLLRPVPTMTSERRLHGRPMPIIPRSSGYYDPWDAWVKDQAHEGRKRSDVDQVVRNSSEFGPEHKDAIKHAIEVGMRCMA